MEYGAIAILMDLFKITKDDLDINDNPELKKYDIWIEGYISQGHSAKAQLVVSSVQAPSFRQACDNHHKEFGGYNSDTLTICGFKLFDNQQDARKSFG
jgi:hypothetical protein